MPRDTISYMRAAEKFKSWIIPSIGENVGGQKLVTLLLIPSKVKGAHTLGTNSFSFK